jgi:hypothetical protein
LDETAAEAAYENCETSAIALATGEGALPNLRRAFIKSLNTFFFTLTSQEELRPLRRSRSEILGTRGLPAAMRRFLAAKGIPEPHPNATNPVLGIYHHFWYGAITDSSIVSPTDQDHLEVDTLADVAGVLAANNDPDRERLATNRLVLNGKYAKVWLASI